MCAELSFHHQWPRPPAEQHGQDSQASVGELKEPILEREPISERELIVEQEPILEREVIREREPILERLSVYTWWHSSGCIAENDSRPSALTSSLPFLPSACQVYLKHHPPLLTDLLASSPTVPRPSPPCPTPHVSPELSPCTCA